MLLDRRLVLAGAGAFVTSPARAQKSAPVVGYLASGGPNEASTILYRDAMMSGLASAGYRAPANMRWIERTGDGTTESLEAVGRELVADGATVILASGAATRAAIRGVAGQVPVVYATSSEPVAAGFATSLATPLGNATGISLM